MKYILGIFLFFMGLAVQWFWSTHMTAWGMAPHILLMLTIAVAGRSGPVAGQCYGFAWGIFLDVASAHIFGSNALAFTLVGYGVGVLRRQMDVESLAPQIILVALLTPVYFLFIGLVGAVFEHAFLWIGWNRFLLEPLYSCIVAPLGFKCVRKLVDF